MVRYGLTMAAGLTWGGAGDARQPEEHQRGYAPYARLRRHAGKWRWVQEASFLHQRSVRPWN